jgi:hypothetical protein
MRKAAVNHDFAARQTRPVGGESGLVGGDYHRGAVGGRLLEQAHDDAVLSSSIEASGSSARRTSAAGQRTGYDPLRSPGQLVG